MPTLLTKQTKQLHHQCISRITVNRLAVLIFNQLRLNTDRMSGLCSEPEHVMTQNIQAETNVLHILSYY
jgi:hypothetical protein